MRQEAEAGDRPLYVEVENRTDEEGMRAWQKKAYKRRSGE